MGISVNNIKLVHQDLYQIHHFLLGLYDQINCSLLELNRNALPCIERHIGFLYLVVFALRLY